MHLSNKVTIVTGAGDGIGRHIAYAFAAQGARVCVADINWAGAELTRAWKRGILAVCCIFLF